MKKISIDPRILVGLLQKADAETLVTAIKAIQDDLVSEATVTFLAQKWISKGQKNEMRKSSETKAKNLVSKFSLNSAIFQTDIFLSKYI